jgi:hypothetical protein
VTSDALVAECHCVQIGPAAIFRGHIESQPVVELVADAETEQRRAVETFAPVVEQLRVEVLGDVVHLLDGLVRHADVAAEIPARGDVFLDRRRIDRRHRHVSRMGHGRKECDGSGNGRDFHTHHDITFSSRGAAQRLRGGSRMTVTMPANV